MRLIHIVSLLCIYNKISRKYYMVTAKMTHLHSFFIREKMVR